MIKESNLKDRLRILNVYIFKNKAAKYIKQNWVNGEEK